MERKIHRLILKDNDVLVIGVPMSLFTPKTAKTIYQQIRKKLLPRKNKILILPKEIDISVIGEKQIREHISNIDLWSLWDENGEETDQKPERPE